MSLTIDGLPGLLSTAEVERLLRRHPLPDGRPRRVNQLDWPSDARRWATLDLVADDTRRRAWSGRELTVVLNDGAGGRQEFRLKALPMRPLSPPGELETLRGWLAPLVDRRWFWREKPVPAAVDDAASWPALFSILGDALGVELACDPAADYLTPATGDLRKRFRSVAELLDAAAWSVGRRVLVEPSGRVLLPRFEEAESRVAENFRQSAKRWIAGGRRPAALPPRALTLLAPKYVDRMLPPVADAARTRTLAERGETLTIRTLCPADYTPTGSQSGEPANAVRLDALAARLAADEQAIRKTAYDATWAGIVPWRPTALDDLVRFELRPTDADAVTTRIRSGPPPRPDRQLSRDPDLAEHPDVALVALDALLTEGGQAAATIHRGPQDSRLAGLEAATERKITLYDFVGQELPAGTRALAWRDRASERWYPLALGEASRETPTYWTLLTPQTYDASGVTLLWSSPTAEPWITLLPGGSLRLEGSGSDAWRIEAAIDIQAGRDSGTDAATSEIQFERQSPGNSWGVISGNAVCLAHPAGGSGCGSGSLAAALLSLTPGDQLRVRATRASGSDPLQVSSAQLRLTPVGLETGPVV